MLVVQIIIVGVLFLSDLKAFPSIEKLEKILEHCFHFPVTSTQVDPF